jgi:aminoglycoside/choline kinase family phosphotransferase
MRTAIIFSIGISIAQCDAALGAAVFLDYQGGRKGALQYDIASLLYDGKADLPPRMRQELLDHYLECLAGFIDLDREAFMEHYYAYVYVRILQALGAYGFRGFYERKAHFLQSVPYALKNLRWLLTRQAAHRAARADGGLDASRHRRSCKAWILPRRH